MDCCGVGATAVQSPKMQRAEPMRVPSIPSAGVNLCSQHKAGQREFVKKLLWKLLNNIKPFVLLMQERRETRRSSAFPPVSRGHHALAPSQGSAGQSGVNKWISVLHSY